MNPPCQFFRCRDDAVHRLDKLWVVLLFLLVVVLGGSRLLLEVALHSRQGEAVYWTYLLATGKESTLTGFFEVCLAWSSAI
jgi:hypothetical protein